jgi:hypothetical protein
LLYSDRFGIKEIKNAENFEILNINTFNEYCKILLKDYNTRALVLFEQNYKNIVDTRDLIKRFKINTKFLKFLFGELLLALRGQKDYTDSIEAKYHKTFDDDKFFVSKEYKLYALYEIFGLKLIDIDKIFYDADKLCGRNTIYYIEIIDYNNNYFDDDD